MTKDSLVHVITIQATHIILMNDNCKDISETALTSPSPDSLNVVVRYLLRLRIQEKFIAILLRFC